MATWRDMIRDGSWLTKGRLTVYPMMFLVLSALSLVGALMLADGINGFDGQPVGTDFSNVYAAGRLALDHRPADAYDWARHGAVERQIFGPQTPYFGWHYPPIFLGIAAGLALLPYLAALALWQAASLGCYLLSLRSIFGRWDGWVVPALAYPAVLINLGHGQNGFLTAALIGGGLALLRKHPLFAGLLLGCLCYKPQFVVLVPIALAAGGHWRALLAMAASVASLVFVTYLVFGPETFAAFAQSAEPTRTIVLEQGSTGWPKIQSAFSAARNWGASVGQAYTVQGLVTTIALCLTVLVWRGALDGGVKAAVLIAASLAATPYSLDYDLMALAPAIAFLVVDGQRRGFRPYEATLLAALWAMPLVARLVMKATTLPIGAACVMTLLIFAAWPALSLRSSPSLARPL